jgi:hypothetical protein
MKLNEIIGYWHYLTSPYRGIAINFVKFDDDVLLSVTLTYFLLLELPYL